MSYIRYSHRITILAGAVVVLSLATPAMAGCQSGSAANNNSTFLLSSANCQANGSGEYATAVGDQAQAAGFGGVATGFLAKANGPQTVAIGQQAKALGLESTSVGFQAGHYLAVQGATSLGTSAVGLGRYSVVIGALATAPGDYSIAIGSGDGKAPFGKPLVSARSNYFLSIALGNSSVADSDFGMAFGFNAKAGTGVVGPIGPIAIGPDARATLTNATALGRFSAATAANTTALGSGSTATQNSSVALGYGSVANVANTVSVGTNTARRRIVNVAPGIANTDVPTLGQVKNIATATAETSNADLRQEVAELRAMVKQQQQEIAQLKGQKAAALNQ